jgi:hypothetical protein
MQRKATIVEAHRLLNEFGPEAYEKVLAAEGSARRKRDQRLAKFLSRVARRILIDTARKQQPIRNADR